MDPRSSRLALACPFLESGIPGRESRTDLAPAGSTCNGPAGRTSSMCRPAGRQFARSSRLGFRGLGLLFLALAVGPQELLVELVNPARRIDELDGAGEEGMALRADLDHDLGLGAAGLERVTTAASHHAIYIFGMNAVFHCNPCGVGRTEPPVGV